MTDRSDGNLNAVLAACKSLINDPRVRRVAPLSLDQLEDLIKQYKDNQWPPADDDGGHRGS